MIFNSFIPAAIAIFSGTNPARVAQRWIAKGIQSSSGQSERAFHAFHCFSIYLGPVVRKAINLIQD